MKRIAMVVVLIAMMPLIMGGGGANPGPPGGTKIAGPTFNASVVLDPHELLTGPGGTPATSTAKQASIRLYSNQNTAGLLFKVPAFFPFFLGCDLTKTDARFRFVTLINWIPEDVLNALFIDLGTGRSPTFEPIITKVENDNCTFDPANPNTTDASIPGILSFQATVRFLVPKP